MPILTKAAAPVKGTATLFTLDKTALAAVTSVAADIYFSIQAKWQSVSLVYNSLIGNQYEIVKFDATKSSPTSKFSVSARARDVFQIKKIIIKDFDGGTFEVLRSELTTAEFDVDMSPSGVIFDTFYNNVASTGLGELHRTGGTDDWINTAYRSTPVTGDFVFSGSVTLITGLTPYSEQLMIGYQKNSMPLSATANPTNNFASALFAHSSGSIVETYNGTGGTASNPGTVSYTAGTFPFSISRVGSSIIGIFNGVTKLIDTYSGDLYIGVSLFNNNGQGISDSTLV